MFGIRVLSVFLILMIGSSAVAADVKYEKIKYEDSEILFPLPDSFCRVKNKSAEKERLKLLSGDPTLVPLMVIEGCSKSVFSTYPWGYVGLQPAKLLFGRDLNHLNIDYIKAGQIELNGMFKKMLQLKELPDEISNKVEDYVSDVSNKTGLEIEVTKGLGTDGMYTMYSGDDALIFVMTVEAKVNGLNKVVDNTSSSTLIGAGVVNYYLYSEGDSGKSFLPNTALLKSNAVNLRNLN
jgi:hypothetical protein